MNFLKNTEYLLCISINKYTLQRADADAFIMWVPDDLAYSLNSAMTGLWKLLHILSLIRLLNIFTDRT